MPGEVEHGNIPLLTNGSTLSSDQPGKHINRTGTVWTAIAHIITAVIGSGVLSLAWSIAQLGWIAGPLAILFFAAITLTQASLLADCYRSPDSEHGHIRNYSYMDAVKLNLGKRSLWFSGFVILVGLYGSGVAYTITSATSMRGIQQSECHKREGIEAPCMYGDSTYILLFGFAQIVISQIPYYHDMEWLSSLSAIMSFFYASIGVALGLAKVIGNGQIKGGIGGVPMATRTKKILRASQALGDIAFAYPFSTVLLEIEDTLKSPPAENQTMKKAAAISIFITSLFYMCCGCFGYAAFGDDTPGNLLSGSGFYKPYWLIELANLCIILHLLGGYQVYSHPVFAFFERWFAERFPNSRLANNFYTIKIPYAPPCSFNPFRVCIRTVYVAFTTGGAMFFPYFNEVLGLLGAFGFWPLAIYFPVQMYSRQRKIAAWTCKWVILQTFSAVCFVLSMVAFVGSIEGLISEKVS